MTTPEPRAAVVALCSRSEASASVPDACPAARSAPFEES